MKKIVVWKLFRLLKSGKITSLFIGRTRRLPIDTWMIAESIPTKGFAVRPFWHCTLLSSAPHLSEKGRIWLQVEIDDYQEFKRPDCQGGVWYLAKKMRILPNQGVNNER